MKKRSMSAPNPSKERVTRADLEAAIEPLATKVELEAASEPLATKLALEPLATKLALEPLATKVALEPLATKVALEPLATKVALDALRTDLKTEIQQVQVSVEELRSSAAAEFALVRAEMVTKERFEDVTRAVLVGIESVRTDLVQHVNTILTRVTDEIAVVDEKYADLPERMTALEERQR